MPVQEGVLCIPSLPFPLGWIFWENREMVRLDGGCRVGVCSGVKKGRVVGLDGGSRRWAVGIECTQLPSFLDTFFLSKYSIRFPPINENKIFRNKVRKVSNREYYWKILKCFFYINVFPPHQKRVFLKNNASFLNFS